MRANRALEVASNWCLLALNAAYSLVNSFSLEEIYEFLQLIGDKVMTLVARTFTQFAVRVNNLSAWFAFKLKFILKFSNPILKFVLLTIQACFFLGAHHQRVFKLLNFLLERGYKFIKLSSFVVSNGVRSWKLFNCVG